MFDLVVLRRAEGGLPISGQIAEALLYYQRVHVVVDRGTLFALLKQLGPQQLTVLLRRPELSAVYCEEMLATHTESVGAFQIHRCVAITLSGDQSVGQLKTVDARLPYELERQGLDRKTAKRFAAAFLARVPVRRFSGDHFVAGGVPDAARRDLLDPVFTRRAIRTALALTPGGYDPGEDLKFDIIDSDLGLHVFTDIDFARINARRAALSGTHDPITAAHLLSNVQDARADVSLASHYGGDFVTSQVVSSIIRARHEELLRRTSLNQEARCQFEEVVIPDMPTVAEIIDAGERSLSEFLVLLDRADRFKRWLNNVNPDEGVVRTYLRDVAAENWVNSLPSKGARYIITQALDATNPVIGVVAGIVDNFLIEKLLGGWRPNHFVKGSLAPFVREGSSE
jgi:hypothetical protein